MCQVVYVKKEKWYRKYDKAGRVIIIIEELPKRKHNFKRLQN